MPKAVEPTLDDYLAQIPPDRQDRFTEIVSLTDQFCADHLTEEYRHVCRLLATGLFQLNLPTGRGKAASWACGIVHVIAQLNFLLFSDADLQLTTGQIHSGFGISAATMYKLSREIREGMQISVADKHLFIPSARENHSVLSAISNMAEFSNIAEMQFPSSGQSPSPETIVDGFLTSIRGGGKEPDVSLPRTDLAYELRISLPGPEPEIWRHLRLPDCTLSDLHHVIQAAMGWDDAHLHEFVVNKTHYQPEPPEDLPDWMRHESDDPYTHEFALSDIIPERSRRFRFKYIYDFGDHWEHEIAVVKKLKGAEAEAVKRPVCLDGAMACPPEDIGGVWGYYDLLDALTEPETDWHRELVEMYEWFDPEQFDAKELNQEFKRCW